MKVPIRKTLTGTEYWDTKDKRTLFVPKGEKPKFEVTENPKSLIGKVSKKPMNISSGGVDLASGKDMTVGVNRQTTAGPGDTITTSSGGTQTDTNLEEMNTGQLIAFAEKNGINVPGNMKKLETIRKFIADQLDAESK